MNRIIITHSFIFSVITNSISLYFCKNPYTPLQDPDRTGWSRVEGSDFFYNVIVANCHCNIMKEIPLYGCQVGPTPHNGTDWFYYRDREPAYLDREVLLAVLRPFFCLSNSLVFCISPETVSVKGSMLGMVNLLSGLRIAASFSIFMSMAKCLV